MALVVLTHGDVSLDCKRGRGVWSGVHGVRLSHFVIKSGRTLFAEGSVFDSSIIADWKSRRENMC